MIGQRLGQYEIIALLGQGGMATVYRARQVSVNRDVAIKVIRPDLAQTSEFLQRFRREAQMVASLSHPFILKVFDFGETADSVYLVMELLKGGSLADLLAKERLPLATTTRLIEQIASALDYAHHLGIIHRDLKPQNVILDDQGNALLTDFGIAKIVTDSAGLTKTGAAMGTPSYMAPEQWQNQSLDARTDEYALAIMAFEMLSGALPFQADTPFGFMYMHIHEAPASLRTLRADLPPRLDAVITKALAKNPDQRYSSAGEFAKALSEAAASVPEAAKTQHDYEDDEDTIEVPKVQPRRATPVPDVGDPSLTIPEVGVLHRDEPPQRNRIANGLLVVIAILIVGGLGYALHALTSSPAPAATPTPAISAASPTSQFQVAAAPTSATQAVTQAATSDATPIPPTNTTIPATNTSVLPTVLVAPPADTTVPTNTSVPPTNAAASPTDTVLPPSSTSVPATATPIPPSATAQPSDTPAPSATLTLQPSPTEAVTDTPIPTDTPTNTPTDTITPFLTNLNGWHAGKTGQWVNTAGGLQGQVTGDDSVFLSSTSASDFTYEADFTITDGSSRSSAGLMFRSKPDPIDGSYVIRVSTYNGGQINFFKFFGGKAHPSFSQIALRNLPIRQNILYHLTVQATGNRFKAVLNGQQVLDGVDSSYTSGLFGLDIYDATVQFQNVNLVSNG